VSDARTLFSHATRVERSAARLVALVASNAAPVAVEMELRVLQRRIMEFPRDAAAQAAASAIELTQAALGVDRYSPTQTGPIE